jgi:hypothetical protein
MEGRMTMRYESERQYPDEPGDSAWAQWYRIFDTASGAVMMNAVLAGDVEMITNALSAAYAAGSASQVCDCCISNDCECEGEKLVPGFGPA